MIKSLHAAIDIKHDYDNDIKCDLGAAGRLADVC